MYNLTTHEHHSLALLVVLFHVIGVVSQMRRPWVSPVRFRNSNGFNPTKQKGVLQSTEVQLRQTHVFCTNSSL